MSADREIPAGHQRLVESAAADMRAIGAIAEQKPVDEVTAPGLKALATEAGRDIALVSALSFVAVLEA